MCSRLCKVVVGWGGVGGHIMCTGLQVVWGAGVGGIIVH